VTAESLVDSAMENILILEEAGFEDIVVSIKSSDIFSTIEANKLMAETRSYPIHIGLTEAGYGLSCIVQSSMVIGHLLLSGIGDTIRVSMTGNPVNEAVTGRKILESLDLRYTPFRIISCPTCGRTARDIDLLAIAEKVESELSAKFSEKLKNSGKRITVAVMGCEVNGPGEAKEADFGLAGGQNGKMVLFARGEVLRTVSVTDAVEELLREIRSTF
ncbi:MAG: flavodoxin-dependent (E)-4-hydroxy-3-methylbut-2-enyl-diphosphate synthase, partial [Spirochaetes bacterium]|nr:flavodoxin-dependent (E)-4-hydroxy-3-methylbut-2-enyl-diphosphate synthase [Spirochaetota bacterium]